ncbi:TIGR03086 family metal-binding protein [Streptomyces morookaense]|uniref:TIGR03086 family protein n=1 Tax=Streptomyces morookaense TaxID=1970 RepID=A0A7Y7B8R2_STRMO|nr:TIGR03086 family metal-binding protein [Streptomyces morookaense]NVK80651.1 TIGR03086 family protein [Streptomyces morookaense]GHF12826.1 TIGR03086 family protein [Streptomyces morookaense]
MNTTTDPRPLLARATAQLAELVATVPAERLGDPTPCEEFDIRGLLAHLVGGLEAGALLGETGEPRRLAPVTDVPDDGWAAAYEAGRARLAAAWADDAKLDMAVAVPWGEMPGRAYLASGCVLETVAHTWDLSQALGHPLPLDQELGEYALEWARQKLTADRRGEGVPFGPVRPAPEDADAYGRLAAWLGRTV